MKDYAFRTSLLTLPLTSIVPRKMEGPKLVSSALFKQILASIREIGLIEPLIVYPQDDNKFLLLDGHLRLEALKILEWKEVKCIISMDDESYTTTNE